MPIPSLANGNVDTAQRILPLPKNVASQICSSNRITSLQGVVLALVENCLDAGAGVINIEIDFRRGNCVVEDDGCGIIPSEFDVVGGLGKIYHTSKYCLSEKDEVHGRTGTFLASLAALSLLSIMSRNNDQSGVSKLTVHQGRVLQRSLASNHTDQHLLMPGRGTRVQVRDLFGNMPVRVKHRVLRKENNTEDQRAWQELRYGLVALLLFWQRPCYVTCRDEDTPKSGRSILKFTTSHPALRGSLTEKHLHHSNGPKFKGGLKYSPNVLTQAGMCPAESLGQWVSATASIGSLSVKGIICLQPAPTKLCQFLSFGIHPCCAWEKHHELFDSINNVFTRSSFGAVEHDTELQHVKQDWKKNKHKAKADDGTHSRLQNSKSVDRWPMFVMRIQSSEKQSNRSVEGRTSNIPLNVVIDLLEATCTQWLSAHGFLPGTTKKRKAAKLHPASLSETDSRCAKPNTLLDLSPDPQALHLSGLNSNSTRDASMTLLKKSRLTGSSGYFRPLDHEALKYNDSSSDIATLSHIRSGRPQFYDTIWQSQLANLPLGQHSSTEMRSQAKVSGPVAGATRPRTSATISPRLSITSSRQDIKPPGLERPESSWLPNFLQDWTNPVFSPPQEQSITCARTDCFDATETSRPTTSCSHGHSALALGCYNAANMEKTKISKPALHNAKVISQVDQKFILCRMPMENESSMNTEYGLILIDQHAASERILLEDLFSDLCSAMPRASALADFRTSSGARSAISTTFIERGLAFQIPAQESRLFALHERHFARWGILYDLLKKRKTVATSQDRLGTIEHHLVVRTLPGGIAERCRLSPDLLIELLRTELWNVAGPNNRPSTTNSKDTDPTIDVGLEGSEHRTDHSWVSKIGDCPKGIIEMLNSRACRSAVMFNDVLSVAECEDIVAKLRRCAFPFICAHGRVSVVPLVGLGHEANIDTGILGNDERKPIGEGLVGHFKRWLEKDMS